MEGYVCPSVIASYTVEELRADAAACVIYQLSDERLKTDITAVGEPLDRLGEIRTV